MRLVAGSDDDPAAGRELTHKYASHVGTGSSRPWDATVAQPPNVPEGPRQVGYQYRLVDRTGPTAAFLLRAKRYVRATCVFQETRRTPEPAIDGHRKCIR
jgi:hypothetical protein